MRMHGSGATTSIWMEETAAPRRGRLARASKADVCVVGAGLAGVTTAYLLARAGRRVVVLEDRFVGGGETGRTTAHLTAAMDDRIHAMARWHGDDGVRQIVQAHQGAIDRIEEIQAREGIDCAFQRVPGHLFLAPGDVGATLEKEETAARRAGLRVGFRTSTPVGGFEAGPSLRFEEQGMFHPLRYLHGLAAAAERHGARIHEGVRVEGVEETERGVEVRTADGARVTAQDVVVATNAPITDRLAIHTKQAPYRTYAMSFDLGDEKVAPGLYWETGWPYHYVRTYDDPAAGGRRHLIVGGGDHRTGLREDTLRPHEELEAWARERWPRLGAVGHRWSGQVLEPTDGAAFVGRDPAHDSRVHLITGDSGQGMTHTTLGAHIVTHQILGQDDPAADAFDAARKARPVGNYLRENTRTNAQYLRLLKPLGGGSLASIPVGEGRVLQRRGRPVAVYRAGPRRHVALSGNCRHLGCPVSWNTLEKTWDCRCHGSRYAPTGEPLNGPAYSPLQPWQAPLEPARRRREAPAAARQAVPGGRLAPGIGSGRSGAGPRGAPTASGTRAARTPAARTRTATKGKSRTRTATKGTGQTRSGGSPAGGTSTGGTARGGRSTAKRTSRTSSSAQTARRPQTTHTGSESTRTAAGRTTARTGGTTRRASSGAGRGSTGTRRASTAAGRAPSGTRSASRPTSQPTGRTASAGGRTGTRRRTDA